MNIKRLLERYGQKYSDVLRIRLASGDEKELFKWLIASLLLGKRISETLAIRTYMQFRSEGLLSFSRMGKLSWDDLVKVLDDGGYVRYDFSTASTLQAMLKTLAGKYNGTLNTIHETAKDPRDLETRLQELKGVGPVTANIFLREMRGIWRKADPPLGHLAKKAAKELRIKDPKAYWKKNKVRGYDFANFETALMRLGREARRKKCSVRELLSRKA